MVKHESKQRIYFGALITSSKSQPSIKGNNLAANTTNGAGCARSAHCSAAGNFWSSAPSTGLARMGVDGPEVPPAAIRWHAGRSYSTIDIDLTRRGGGTVRDTLCIGRDDTAEKPHKTASKEVEIVSYLILKTLMKAIQGPRLVARFMQ